MKTTRSLQGAPFFSFGRKHISNGVFGVTRMANTGKPNGTVARLEQTYIGTECI